MFNLSAPFIRRPIGTSLLAIGLFLLGVIAYHFLPVAPLPQIDVPTIFTSVQQPGASPQTMASTVAAPLERRFGQIAGLNELTSSSSLGSSTVIMQFDLSKDIDAAARDVAAAINAAAADLPAGLPNPPTYRKANPNDAPVMILALTSDSYPLSELYNYADSLLAQRISQVKGVSQVDIAGGAQPATHIQINSAALSAMQLNLDDVRSALSGLSANAPKGALGNASQNMVITANDQLDAIQDYQNLVIGMRNGVPLRLSSIASIVPGQVNAFQAGWFNKQRSVLLIVRKQADANIIKTVDGVKALLPMLSTWLPQSVHLEVQTDRTLTIRSSLHDVQFSLLLSVALVIMVMLLFLRRWTPTLIAGVTVPLSLAGTFAAMWALGYSLDNFSLMALTVAVGFVVDDAIVVIENIVRHIEQDEAQRLGDDSMSASAEPGDRLAGGHAAIGAHDTGPGAGAGFSSAAENAGVGVQRSAAAATGMARQRVLQAALLGGREIGFTVLSMSLSLIAVFIPILFMGGLVGRLFREFSVTLAVAIAVSGVVSLTLTPSLCGRFLRSERGAAGTAPRRPNWLMRQAERGLDAMLRGYTRGLDWSLRHSWLMLLVTLATVVATVYLYIAVPKGFFPSQDTGMISGSTEGAQDISFAAMMQKQQQAAAIILADPDVVSMGSFLGGRNSANNGSMFISLRAKGDGRKATVDAIINRLRPKFAAITGLGVYLQPVQDVRVGGRPGKSLYTYTLQSSDIEDLYAWVPKLVDQLKTTAELKDVSTDLEKSGLQMNVVVDRDAASRLGLTPATVDQALGNAFAQSQILITYTQLNEYHVVLEALPDEQRSPDTLSHIYIKGSGGQSVPLSAIARFEAGTAPLSISHQGQFPVVNITFNLAPDVSLGQATEVINRAMLNLHMPGNIRGSFAGNAQLFQQSISTLPILILTALLAVYIVLGMLYESLIHPLTILSTLPSAGIGALLALQLTGTDLSIVAIIGIILLIGIVKKNAIMMIDFALDAERRGALSPRDAIYQACLVRFRPIMMTTLAALFGAVPLALGMGTGSELRQPLGIAIVGGLLLSQMMTLFTTPVVYLALERLSTRHRRRRSLPSAAPSLG